MTACRPDTGHSFGQATIDPPDNGRRRRRCSVSRKPGVICKLERTEITQNKRCIGGGMRFATAILLTAVFLTPIRSVDAQGEPAPASSLNAGTLESIDAFVNSEMTRQHISGLAVGIYNRGHILLAKGYGLANVELNVPVRAETLFQAGSVGKQFISAAIMMLVEERKLSLDDSITKFLPHSPSAWKPIRVEGARRHN